MNGGPEGEESDERRRKRVRGDLDRLVRTKVFPCGESGDEMTRFAADTSFLRRDVGFCEVLGAGE